MTKLKLMLALFLAACFFSGRIALMRSPDVQAQQPAPRVDVGGDKATPQDKDKAGVKKDEQKKNEPKKPEPFLNLKEKLKKQEDEIAKIRAAMLKEIDDEEKKVDEALKKAKQAKATADMIKAQQEKFQLSRLRNDIEMRFRVPSDKTTKPAPGGPLGCDLKEPSATLAAQMNLPKAKGLIVTKVFEGRPADKAGLKAHDVLLKFAGSDVPDNPKSFLKELEKTPPAGSVEAVILRGGKQQTVTLSLAPPPAKTGKASKPGDDEK